MYAEKQSKFNFELPPPPSPRVQMNNCGFRPKKLNSFIEHVPSYYNL